MKRLLALLTLFSIEGLAAFLWTFFSPSEVGHAVFLWLSTQRLLLSIVALIALLALMALALSVRRSRAASDRILQTFDRWCIDEQRLAALLIPLIVAPLLIAAAIAEVLRTPLEYAAYQAWAPNTFPLLRAVVGAILPLVCLSLLLCFEAAAFLGLRYRRILTTRETWSWGHISTSLIFLLIAAAAVFHWIILAFQLRTFVNIPAWYWKIEPLPFSWRDGWFALGFLAVFGLAWVAIVLTRRIVAGLLLIVFLGWFLQIGVGVMGDGFATIGERYFSTYHKAYVVQASQSHVTILDGIRRYEELFAAHAFTSTKPPGLMAFYMGLDHLVNGFPSAYADDIRYERLSRAIADGFPLLALLIVPLLYAFGRRFVEDSTSFGPSVAPLLYMLAPSAVLFSLFPDQAIYPALFLIGIWLTIVVIRRGSLPLAFGLGALLYLFVFFAFTMLPLYPFAGIYLILHTWRSRSGVRWGQAMRLAAAIGLGTLVLLRIACCISALQLPPAF